MSRTTHILNSPALILLFNHRLTAQQEEDTHISLGVIRIIDPPINITTIWAQVPPDAEEPSLLWR